MKRWRFFGSIITFLLINANVAAISEERVEITGERIRGDIRQQVTFITGNVRIVQGPIRITAAQAVFHLEEKRIHLTGQVLFDNGKTVVRANYLEYDLQKRNGFFREDVVLHHLLKPSGEGVNEGPLDLLGEQVYFDANTQEMIAESATFRHADFSGGADRISYDDNLGELLLIGTAYLKNEDNEEIRSERIDIQLNVKRFIAEGNVTVSFEVDDKAVNP